MKIIITAAGEGSRFQKVGIKKPKYKLIAKGFPLFYWSLISLKKFFDESFILIFRKDIYDKNFVEKWMKELGIQKYSVILIENITKGQAETAMCANQYLNKNDSILIYNIDTHINPDALSRQIENHDGCIVTTKIDGDRWSFAKIGSDGFVDEVSEKIRISDNASVGLYYFKKWDYFMKIYENHKDNIKNKYKEIYVCPMYRYLINEKKKITIFNIELNDFCCLGTPEEIDVFDNNWMKYNV